MQLKSSVSPARRAGGKLAAALLLAGSCVGGLSAQASGPAATHYKVHFEMADSAPAILVQAGVPGTVTVGQGSEAWSTRVVVTPAGNDVVLKTQVSHGGKELKSFTLQMAEGGRGSFLVTDGDKEFKVALRVAMQK